MNPTIPRVPASREDLANPADGAERNQPPARLGSRNGCAHALSHRLCDAAVTSRVVATLLLSDRTSRDVAQHPTRIYSNLWTLPGTPKGSRIRCRALRFGSPLLRSGCDGCRM